MGESLVERMERVHDVLRWLGKYDEANACKLLIRLMRTYELTMEE